MEEVAYPRNLSKPDIWQTLPLNSLNVFVDWIDLYTSISLSIYLSIVQSFVLLGQKGGFHPLQGGRRMRGRRRCVFLIYFFDFSKKKGQTREEGRSE